MFLAGDWQDYEIIDTGDGMKYERWGEVYLLRPDPQVIWPYFKEPDRVDGIYRRSDKGGGAWSFPGRVPQSWTVSRKGLTFKIKPMGFKHTGLFPEQAANWDWMSGLIERAQRPDKPVRWIVDDCRKFVEREIRRGNKYDGIIMDPPSYGRGPSGQIWKLEDELYPFVSLCMNVLSDNPLFILINSYTTGLQPLVLYNILTKLTKNLGGRVDAQEVGLPVTRGGIILPCGASGRWQKD